MNPTPRPEATRVAFRTHAGRRSGLGHLVRCVNLAGELRALGADCHFFLDDVEAGSAAFLQGFPADALYDTPPDTLDAEADARRFLQRAGELSCPWVVLDDYRLDDDWEGVVKAAGLSVCAFDDLLRPHQCDLLVDMRWRRDDTASAYADRVSPGTTRLLGPAYAMLGPAYRQRVPSRPDTGIFRILVSLGGAGDLAITRDIVDRLLRHAGQFKRPLQLCPVLGPLSGNHQDFLARYRGRPEVQPVVGATDLYPQLCRSDLYIGATGGMLYQLLALKIPALTFALGENQQSDPAALQDIGHYFHLGDWTPRELDCLPDFVAAVMGHRARIRRLTADASVPVDGFGARRVAEALLGLPATTPPRSEHPASRNETPEEALSDVHRLRPVTDRDINHYLASRNLAANRGNMIDTGAIAQLSHYAWWFGAPRQSYLLTRDGEPCLYIWHQRRSVQGREFLIGGWFVCGERAGFQDALLALDWQLRHCEREAPGVPWIAVIQRQNRYVQLLNRYLGFTEVEAEHPYVPAIASAFPDAHRSEFQYLVREPAALTRPQDLEGMPA
jgi:spore coat polysaccharide biosynthesis predicted glycosyltransferase SpsG